MKPDIKNNDIQECQQYVPASVKVIDLSTNGIICLSNGTEDSQEGSTEDWF